MTATRAVVALTVALVLAAVPRNVANAQSSTGTCVASAVFGSGSNDVCQKGRDLFSFVTPQIGVAVAGGNALPGEGGALGGLGKRVLSVRVVAVDGSLPKNTVPLTVGTSTASDFGASRTAVPLPAVDVGIGLLPGVPFGLTNVGGVDLLLGATYLPTVSRNTLKLDPDGGGIGFSYGIRVGALQESSLVPGVSVSWQRRQLPTTDFNYTPGNDTLNITGVDVRTDALRVVISKRLPLFGIAAGAGQDRINAAADMRGTVNENVAGVPVRETVTLFGLRERTTRNTAFVNASFGVLAFRIVGEYGWSGAGTLRETVNGFGGRRANEGYRYGSLGVTTRF